MKKNVLLKMQIKPYLHSKIPFLLLKQCAFKGINILVVLLVVRKTLFYKLLCIVIECNKENASQRICLKIKLLNQNWSYNYEYTFTISRSLDIYFLAMPIR